MDISSQWKRICGANFHAKSRRKERTVPWEYCGFCRPYSRCKHLRSHGWDLRREIGIAMRGENLTVMSLLIIILVCLLASGAGCKYRDSRKPFSSLIYSDLQNYASDHGGQ